MALEHGAGKKLAHSVPVPRLYKFCSKVLAEYFQFNGKIPKLIGKLTKKEPRQMIQLASKLLLALEAKLDVIKAAIENIGVLENNPGFRYEMALVIAADMLLNEVQSKRFDQPCKPVLVMLEVRDELERAYQKCLEEAPAAANKCTPRWVCVNTLLMSTAEAQHQLTQMGYVLKHYSPKSYEQFLLSVRELAEHEFMEDFHFPEMLVFSPLGLRHCHLVLTGKLIMHDKVSYLSPSVCGVTPGEVVVDACAAPGNKSTVLASLLNNHGKLICVERDEERFLVLRKRVKHHGVRCASFINEDFTSLSPDQYEGATTVLLDPSCSNSGVALPTDEASVSDERYRRLSDMQFKLLSFALSIPSVRTVVYSTCSVNSMENENVVARALDRFGNSFELEDLSSKVEGWQSFGDESYPFAGKVLRTKPEFDLCHGFFVAKFVARKKEDCVQESNLEVSNDIIVTDGGVDPSRSKKKKKKREKKSLDSSEIQGCEMAMNLVDIDGIAPISESSREVPMDATAGSQEVPNGDEENESVRESKKKKKKRKESERESLNDEGNGHPRKKKKAVIIEEDAGELDASEVMVSKKKKKNKNKSEAYQCDIEQDAKALNGHENIDFDKKKEKKSRKSVVGEEENLKPKKKKKSEETQEGNCDQEPKQERMSCREEQLTDSENIEPKKKKKKKADKKSLKYNNFSQD